MAQRHIEQLIDRQVHHWDNIAATLGYQPGPGEKGPTQAELARQPVVTFSRDLGCGCREVVIELAERLGYQLFGRDIIDHIAKDLKVQRSIVDVLDEGRRSKVEYFLKAVLGGQHIDDQDYVRALVRVVNAIAERGGVILLGRGAGVILAEAAALRVRLTAPRDFRVMFLSEREGISEEEALDRITRSDGDRRDFLRRCFRVEPDDPTISDLTINTSRVPLTQVPPLILQALEARGIQIERRDAPALRGSAIE